MLKTKISYKNLKIVATSRNKSGTPFYCQNFKIFPVLEANSLCKNARDDPFIFMQFSGKILPNNGFLPGSATDYLAKVHSVGQGYFVVNAQPFTPTLS